MSPIACSIKYNLHIAAVAKLTRIACAQQRFTILIAGYVIPSEVRCGGCDSRRAAPSSTSTLTLIFVSLKQSQKFAGALPSLE